MSGLNDYLTGMQMLNNSLGELAISRSIQGASEAVDQIKNSELEDSKKKLAIKEVANKLALTMLSSNQPASKIEQAMTAFTGQTSEEKAASEFAMQKELINLKSDKELQQQNFLLNKKYQMAKDMAQIKAKSGKPPSDADVSFMTNAKIALNAAKNLERVVKKDGNYESIIGNQKSKAVLESEAYNLAVNYAKIVDPATAAREGEVEAAKKYAIPMGLTVRNEQTLNAIKLMKEKIKMYIKERANAKTTVQEDTSADDIMNFLE